MKKSTARDLLKQIEFEHPDLFGEFCYSLAKVMMKDIFVEINFNKNNMPQLWLEVNDHELTGEDIRPSIIVKKPLNSVLNNSITLNESHVTHEQCDNFHALLSRWAKLFAPNK
jgi:hypothetical protein